MLVTSTPPLATNAPTLGGQQPLPAAAVVASPALSSPDPPVERASESAGQAAFNPFATIGTVVQQHASPAPAPPAGDWSIPVLATVVGAVLVGRMLRRLSQ